MISGTRCLFWGSGHVFTALRSIAPCRAQPVVGQALGSVERVLRLWHGTCRPQFGRSGLRIRKSGIGMAYIGKFAAVALSIAIFAMPTAAMPLHCILKAPSGPSTHPCHMMGMNPSADQINAALVNHSCCVVSAAKPEPIAVPRALGTSSVAPTASQAFLSDLPAAPVFHEPSGWIAQSSGAPQALLCTFLI